MKHLACTGRISAIALLGAGMVFGWASSGVAADGPAGTSSGGAPSPGGSVTTSLEAMRGMSGYFRRTPEGEIFLYPYAKTGERAVPPPPASGMQGMEGMQGMDAMGGGSGYFRVQPSGRTDFYPYPGSPVGMSGMSGKPQ